MFSMFLDSVLPLNFKGRCNYFIQLVFIQFMPSRSCGLGLFGSILFRPICAGSVRFICPLNGGGGGGGRID